MPTSSFLLRCRELAENSGCGPDNQCDPMPEISDADSLIGFFQLFRSDAQPLLELFAELPAGEQLCSRLRDLYSIASDDRRPQGGKDAFFIVRSPAVLSVELAEHHASTWIKGLQSIATTAEKSELASKLSQQPKIRVLEGTAPKKPKYPHEKSDLYKAVAEQSSDLTAIIPGIDPHAELLRSAYYFVARDAALRDYLMWPFFSSQTGLDDPLKGYFELWSHGVKYRIYGEDQIDLYLPRHAVFEG